LDKGCRVGVGISRSGDGFMGILEAIAIVAVDAWVISFLEVLNYFPLLGPSPKPPRKREKDMGVIWVEKKG
jgi:hypothetical protein